MPGGLNIGNPAVALSDSAGFGYVSGLATMVRIVMMYYINLESFLNQPDADLKLMLAEASESPPVEAENQ